MKRYLYRVLIAAAGLCVVPACDTTSSTVTEQAEVSEAEPDSLAIREMHAASPVLSATEAIKQMQVAEGFRVELVAAEPLLSAPVAMAFDEKGRMWVAEMQSYMPDTAGTGEEAPTGKIVLLEDKNSDGKYDTRKIFLDSLVLPRALCFVENGLLVAEPPNLWFYEITNDKPGKRTLVDGKYTEGNNVEHEPNGLFRALDNWIYNAKFSKRYRKKGTEWLTEKTHFRGQWGITQDDQGRLFYNNNSRNLLGDYFAPGLGATNPNQRNVPGFDVSIVPDNKVYPARATTGVNRGYLDGFLDEKLRLVEFTAACGPVIYRGSLFGEAYHQNAFVAEPAANLIKRNILEEIGYQVQGRQAYAGKEFIASRDERFRPVNLYNGPDGALYIVDMYRGIIQHKYFLTDYLAKEIADRKLEQPLNCGRIYKVVPQGSKPVPVRMPQAPSQLVKLLQHPNGWVRDKAQQLLVDGKHTQATPALRQLLQQTSNPVAATHALWTLEGLGALQTEDVLPLLKQSPWPVRMQAMSVLPAIITNSNYKSYLPVLEQLVQQQDTLAAPYVAFLARAIQKFSQPAADKLLEALMQQYPDNRFVAGAIISSVPDREEAFYKKAVALHPDSSLALNTQFRKVFHDISMAKKSRNQELLAKQYPLGAALYKSICQSCHGKDGNGVKSLAPPLNTSDWVTGSTKRLIPIALYGLTGPIRVNNKLYQSPEVIGEMPGIGYNEAISDKDIAELLTYIRKSWNNNAGKVTKEEVTQARRQHQGRQKAFTEQELLAL